MPDLAAAAMQENAMQVWDNAAFDHSTPPRPLQTISLNRLPSAAATKTRHPKPHLLSKTDDASESGDVDAEIARIRDEMLRLSQRLKQLEAKKASCGKKPAPHLGRVVPAKFMAPPPSSSRALSLGPTEIFATPVKARGMAVLNGDCRKRGASLGPLDIFATPLKPSGVKPTRSIPKNEAKGSSGRRGLSLGPSEIVSYTKQTSAVKVGQKAVLHVRKLQDIEEEPSQSRRSASVSPKSRRRSLADSLSDLRKGTATVKGKKAAAKRDDSQAAVKPKALFLDANAKKKVKGARVVASRYSLAPVKAGAAEPESERRKWSLPEPSSEKECAENDASYDEVKTPSSIAKVRDALPKIKNLRCIIESPRDSGCAKRVAELDSRRRSIFDEVEGSTGVSSYESRIVDDD